MSAREIFPEPRPVESMVVKQNKPAIGKAFGKKARAVQQALECLADCEEDALRVKVQLLLLHLLSAFHRYKMRNARWRGM